MKRIIKLIGSCIVGILLCSCLEDVIDKGGLNIEESTLDISLAIEGLGTEVKTRSTVEPTPEEEQVNTLVIIFYEFSETYDGRYVTNVILKDGPYQMDQIYKIQNPLLSAVNAYNVIVIANTDDNLYINGELSEQEARFSGLTEKQFREKVFLNISFPHNDPGIKPHQIPMTGSVTKKAGEGEIKINLKRIVSRLDVVNNVSEYTLQSVSVWNAYYSSSLLGDAVMDYSSVIGLRTQKYYNGSIENNSVTGSLYVFENQVPSPKQNDRFTTCLIIGLSKVGEEDRYFRVNIHPQNSPQHLKRNNIYKVSIDAVNGEGAGTEEDAYTGIENSLSYTINYWDLDDNGLIVSDINSMLAIPVKTARFGRAVAENSYTITTFSSLTSPAPLAIKSQTYIPADGSIVATLTGNILKITVPELPDGADDRTGIITLTFAGLEANMNVLQSSSVDKYLTVKLDDDWFNELSATPNASSENIYVTASGPWTAKLYSGDPDAFTLKESELKTTLSSAEVLNNKFRISTYTGNSTGAVREGFVLVSLDEDHLNYVSVIPIAQKIASAINLVPDIRRVAFNAAGKVEGTSNEAYILRVSTNGSSLKPASLNDNTYFTIIETPESSTSSVIQIRANGENFTGQNRDAILTFEDNSGGSLSINITQNYGGLYLQPSTISSRITAVGGQTEFISVDAGGSSDMTWSATITTSGINGTVYNHEAYIELSDGSYLGTNPVGISPNVRFRIVLPKVYYPNRKVDIAAEVIVTLDNTPLTAEIIANQQALQPKAMNVWSSRNDHWGSINPDRLGYATYFNYYFIPYAQTLSDGKYTLTQGRGEGNSNNNPGGYMSFDLVNICNSAMPSGYDWSAIRAYMQQKDGLTIFACEANAINQLQALNNSPLKTDYNYSFVAHAYSDRVVHSNDAAKNTRVYKILFDYGRSPIPEGDYAGPFYSDAFATGSNVIPSTGIKILQYATPQGNGNGLLVIDPTNGFIYHGDGSITYSEVYMNYGTHNWIFTSNYADFVCLSTLYGSHFMDMLIDYAPGDPKAVAAPWDEIWGPYKWNPDPNDITSIK